MSRIRKRLGAQDVDSDILPGTRTMMEDDLYVKVDIVVHSVSGLKHAASPGERKVDQDCIPPLHRLVMVS